MNGHLQGLYAGEINPTLILHSNKACLHLNGHVKSENKGYWSAENAMVIHKVSLHDVKGHVWYVANVTRITWPIFLDQKFIQIHKTHSNTISYTPVQLTENICLLLREIIQHQTLETISRTHDQIR